MITYPVPENSRWAIYNTDQQSVVIRNRKWWRGDGGEVKGAPKNFVPLLHVETNQPTHDPATQKLVRAEEVIDLGSNTITRGWDVVELSTSELAAIAEQEEEQTQTAAAKKAYTALMDGTGPAAQRLVRCERVIARILRHTLGA